MGMFPSLFGLGTFQFRNATEGSAEARTAAEVWQAAWDRGVRHVDTAEGYGGGVSEAAVGRILDGRGDVFVATKIHYRPSVDEVVLAVDECRARLRRDAIDVVYLHWPKRGLDLRPVMEGLERCRAAGRIRHVGVSNFSVQDLEAAAGVCSVDVAQIGYSLLWRYPERDVIPYCRARGIAIVSYSALAQGLLAGKIRDRAQLPAGDPRLKTVYYDEGVFAGCPRRDRRDGARRRVGRRAAGPPRPRVGARAARHGGDAGRRAARRRRWRRRCPRGSRATRRRPAAPSASITRISDEVGPSIPDIGNIFKHYP